MSACLQAFHRGGKNYSDLESVSIMSVGRSSNLSRWKISKYILNYSPEDICIQHKVASSRSE